MDIRKRVGLNIRRFRLARGLSQEALALEAEIDRSYMSGIERGRRNPGIVVLEKLCDALGVSISDIVGEHAPADEEPRNLPRGRRGQ